MARLTKLYHNWVEYEIKWWGGSTPITTPWVYHSPDLWLVSISSDWNTWYTIQDKNLWATMSDTTSKNSYWNYYSWWALSNRNNIAADTYAVANDWEYWNNGNQSICPTWYHIPTKSEWTTIISALSTLLWIATLNYDYARQYLLLPRAWQMTDSWTTIEYSETSWWWYYWTADKSWTTTSFLLRSTSSNLYSTWTAINDKRWLTVRVFKNDAVQPDSTWTVLYQWS